MNKLKQKVYLFEIRNQLNNKYFICKARCTRIRIRLKKRTLAGLAMKLRFHIR